MASARSKRTYTIGWDGCGSLPFRNGLEQPDSIDISKQTTAQVSFFDMSVLSPQDRQIHETVSLYL